ncbi:MAG: hypothetical protein JXA73_22165 [Acidobacteria bacterium]|nr:hypothetical protein [Acidobacteriota bacterium]
MRVKKIFRIFQINRAYILYQAAALVILLSIGSLPAQFLVQPVNLAYLSQRADVIMQGRITKVVQEPMPGYPNIPTVAVTVTVDQSLRGTKAKTYTFREVLFGLKPRAGKRVYSVGQQMLLFLPSPSQYGLSSPIGIGQGRFHISSDSRGRTTVTNEHSNAGLFRGVDETARKAGKKLTAGQLKLTETERGPVELDEFVSLVKSLTTLPRIR